MMQLSYTVRHHNTSYSRELLRPRYHFHINLQNVVPVMPVLFPGQETDLLVPLKVFIRSNDLCSAGSKVNKRPILGLRCLILF